MSAHSGGQISPLSIICPPFAAILPQNSSQPSTLSNPISVLKSMINASVSAIKSTDTLMEQCHISSQTDTPTLYSKHHLLTNHQADQNVVQHNSRQKQRLIKSRTVSFDNYYSMKSKRICASSAFVPCEKSNNGSDFSLKEYDDDTDEKINVEDCD